VAWRYIVFSEPDGAYLGELELTDVAVTTKLSAPGRLTGTVVGNPDLRLLRPWHVSIYAEDDHGTIRGGGFLTPASWEPDGIKIDCLGRAGYPAHLPWTADPYEGISVDPLDVVRRIWDHIQTQPQGNISVIVDPTATPIRVGTPASGEEKAAPLGLYPWETTDLGAVIDKLAAETPFDYLEETNWDGTKLAHRLRLGYPTLGARRPHLRFALGENLAITPTLDADDDGYASEAWGLGAGEGEAMIRSGRITRDTTGVRRVLTHIDKAATTTDQITTSARNALASLTGDGKPTQIQVIDHPNAPLGSFSVGDEIFLTGTDGWVNLDRWVRIVELTIKPDAGGIIDLTVTEL